MKRLTRFCSLVSCGPSTPLQSRLVNGCGEEDALRLSRWVTKEELEAAGTEDESRAQIFILSLQLICVPLPPRPALPGLAGPCKLQLPQLAFV